jgi:hypothetical protein
MVTIASAREKAKDGAIRQSFMDFKKILELEYNDTGSYANLQPGPTLGLFSDADCMSVFNASNYAADAQKICSFVVENSASHAFTAGSMDTTYQKYSITTTLNQKVMVSPTFGLDRVYCVGSSGTYEGIPKSHQTDLGCGINP